MRPPKTPNGLEINNDLLKDDLWNPQSEPNTWNGIHDFGAHEPMPPNGPSDNARPNERAWSAPPFHGSTPTAYNLDNSQRVLSGEQEGVPNPVTIAGTTSTSSTVATSDGASMTSPFIININWDSSVASAPAGFKAGVIVAVQYLESQFVDAVTVTINVGFGEVNGYNVGGLGASYTWLSPLPYSYLDTALTKDAKSASDAAVVASLPSTSPVNGNYWVTTAQAKALGLASPNGTAVDGYVGFSSNYQFDYDNSDGVASGTYDFNGTVLHEITEVLGRALLTGRTIGSTASSYDAYDLFHYDSASGEHLFVATTPGYFSVDGGTTALGEFNTNSGGDAGDWSSSMGYDSGNAFANSGVVNVFSAVDVVAMDAIGWDLAGSVAPPAAPPAPPPPPTGVTISASDKTLAGALTGAVPIATLTQTGGASGDTFTYQLGGAGAGAFTVSTSANIGTLRSGASGLAGSRNGTVYALTVTATDTTYNQSSPAMPLDVIVGGTDDDTISVKTLSGNLGLATPTFVYGGQGNDTLVGSEMTGRLWLTGGAGGDQMTSGGGVDTYVYGSTSDSTSSAMDIIANFSAASDRIDLSGLGIALQYAGAIPSSGKGAKVNVLGAHSVGWQVSGGNTFVYVNTSGSKENLSATNMKIELAGSVSLNSGNIMHV